jgi:hypothetical protein
MLNREKKEQVWEVAKMSEVGGLENVTWIHGGRKSDNPLKRIITTWKK